MVRSAPKAVSPLPRPHVVRRGPGPLVLTPGGPVTSYDHDAGRAYELAQGFAALLDQHTED